MTKEQLFESIGYLDDDLLERGGRVGTARPVWMRWAAAAACVCIVAGAVIATAPRWRASEQPLPNREETPADRTGEMPYPGETREPLPTSGTDVSLPAVTPAPGGLSETPDLIWNTAEKDASDAAPVEDFYQFAERLTEAELASVLPAWPDSDMGTGSPALEVVSAVAVYYGWGELAQVELVLYDPDVGGTELRVLLRDPARPRYFCILAEPETAAVTEINGVEITAQEYRLQDGEVTGLFAVFERGGVQYVVSANGWGDADWAKKAIAGVGAAFATAPAVPDLSQFHAEAEIVYLDTTPTLAEAQADETFGAYFLRELPTGFGRGELRRRHVGATGHSSGANYLSGFWDDGAYGYLSWRVTYLRDDGSDAARITAVEDRENYDLSLYPIPRGESVPRDKWEIVNDPIFRADALTLDAVRARAYRVDEAGDADGWRMEFSVLYEGNVLVEISAKGVDPEWVYAQLAALR